MGADDRRMKRTASAQRLLRNHMYVRPTSDPLFFPPSSSLSLNKQVLLEKEADPSYEPIKS
jgi:hypothetical protein